MRTRTLIFIIVIVAAVTISWTILSVIARGRKSYSVFSRGFWEEVYPPTFDVSPSGDTVVFTARGEGGSDLFALNLRTRHIVSLTRSPQFEAEVRFLDNSTVITSAVEDPASMSSPQYLYAVNVGDGSRRRLTADPRMRDDTIVPLSRDQFVFSRAEVRKQFNPIWGFFVKPWGFVDVYGVHVGDYLMNLRTGSVEQVHLQHPSILFHLGQVGAVFHDKRRVIQLVSRGATEDMFLTQLSSPLGSPQIRAVRKKRLARSACCPALSEDERFVYFVKEEPPTAQYDIVRLDLMSLQSTRLAGRHQRITCLRLSGQWLFFLEGSGKDVTLWRMDTQGKRLEKLLSPAQFANPLRK